MHDCLVSVVSNVRVNDSLCNSQNFLIRGIDAHSGFDEYRGIRVRFRRGSLKNGYHILGRQQARKLPNERSSR